MYSTIGKGGGVIPVAAGVTATQLPQTGGNLVIQIALALATTLVVWGVTYAINAKVRA